MMGRNLGRRILGGTAIGIIGLSTLKLSVEGAYDISKKAAPEAGRYFGEFVSTYMPIFNETVHNTFYSVGSALAEYGWPAAVGTGVVLLTGLGIKGMDYLNKPKYKKDKTKTD